MGLGAQQPACGSTGRRLLADDALTPAGQHDPHRAVWLRGCGAELVQFSGDELAVHRQIDFGSRLGEAVEMLARGPWLARIGAEPLEDPVSAHQAVVEDGARRAAGVAQGTVDHDPRNA